jgi:arginine utilization protein RocB
MNFSDVRSTTLELTSFASVTNSPGETAFAPWLAGQIGGLAYFRAHPEDLLVERTALDPHERSVIFAFVRGAGTRCLILTGHYDVVGTGCYGGLESLAFDAEKLTAALVSELTREGGGSEAARARDDLESGAFLAGRGVLDMKSGLAAGLEVLDRFASDPGRSGNMLFLAVPDEEDSSHGMRHAAGRIGAFLAARGCSPLAAINLDSAVDQDSGADGRAIFLGSVGKLLPFVHFLGRPTHAGAPFDGINPALLAAEFVRLVESDPEGLGESPGREPPEPEDAPRIEPPPPPTVLYLRETRQSYDVTTPSSVFCALNALSHARSPSEVFSRLGILASRAMESAAALLLSRAREQSRRSGSVFAPPDRAPVLVDFALLADSQAAALEEARASLQCISDPVARSHAIVEKLAAGAGLEGPAAIIGFAPPYYPRASLVPGRDDWFLAILGREAQRMAAETGDSIRLRPYFPGISDMSHLAPSDGPGQAGFVAARSAIPYPETGEGLGCPVVNIGPWGREYHQRLERVHANYSFRVLPELLARIAFAALEEPGRSAPGSPRGATIRGISGPIPENVSGQ